MQRVILRIEEDLKGDSLEPGDLVSYLVGGGELRYEELLLCTQIKAPERATVGERYLVAGEFFEEATRLIFPALVTPVRGAADVVTPRGYSTIMETSTTLEEIRSAILLPGRRASILSFSAVAQVPNCASWVRGKDPTSAQQLLARADDTVGYFRLNNPANVEVMAKALDGRGANGHFWFFHGSLTSQPYTVTVTDTVQDLTKTYFKGSGSFCGDADTTAFYDAVTGTMQGGMLLPLAPITAGSTTAGACFSTDTSVCLLDNRFHVEVWRNGSAVRAYEISELAGTFSFGQWENSDVVVKVLDGTPVNDWYWVFFGSMTSQDYEVRVTDTASGQLKTYPAPGTACGQADTTAF